jgi:hypothetical protein
MPKSKKRGGEKAHRKRVTVRTASVKAEMDKQRRMFEENLEKLRELAKQKENEEEVNTSETVNLNTDGFVQSAEIL